MAHIDLKKDAHIFTQAGVTIQNLLNLVQSFETNELEELRDLINVIKDIDTNDDNTDFKQQLINAINNAVMENEVVDTLDKDSTYPPQTTTVRKALNNLLDNINQIKSNLDDETKNRQDEDTKTVNLIKEESSSRETGDNSIKQELYGTGTESYTLTSNVTPTQVTVSMQNGSGIVEVNISDLKNAFTLNGAQIVSSGKTIATYQITYGENISRLFAVVDYNVQLKTFDFNLVKSDDMTSSVKGNIATLVLGLIEFDYGFNTGQGYFLKNVSKSFPYTYQNVSQNTVIKINGLADLQTIDKSSFMSAINELTRTDIKVNESLNDIKKELNGMSKGGIWHYGEVLTHTANLSTPVINNSVDANIGDFYLNSNTFSVYFCVGDDNGNHNWLYIGNLTGSFDYSNYASINSPNFTGTPTAPTPSVSNNSRQVATTEYVRSAIDKYASGDSSENIDELDKIVDDIYCDNKEWTCTKVDRKFPNVTLKDTSTGEIQINCIDFGRFRFSESLPTEISLFSSTSSKEKITTPNKSVLTYVPQSGEKIYINAEYDWSENVLQLSLASNKIDENKQVDWIDSANKRWQFTLGYYVVTLAQDTSKQYSIQSQTYTLLDNGYFYFANASYKMPLSELPTINHTSILSSIIEVSNNISQLKSDLAIERNNIAETIYSLHPTVEQITISADNKPSNNWYGSLITTEVNELFVLDNQLGDFVKGGHNPRNDVLYTNDEIGYILTKDVLLNQKAFCRVLSNPISGADSVFGEIEVLLTF